MRSLLLFSAVAVSFFLQGFEPGTVAGYSSLTRWNAIETDSLTARLSELQKGSGIVGIGAVVVDPTGIRYAKGFGFADKDRNLPYTANSIQNIASISKTFIGMALLKAQEIGKLDLDDPVNKYLPFEVINPKFPDKEITFRQLSCHTSSIRDTDIYDQKSYVLKNPLGKAERETIEAYENFNTPEDAIPLEEFLKRVLTQEGAWSSKETYLNVAPGETFEYSNVAAALTAFALERAVQTDFKDFTKKHILDPLDMRSSGWGFDRVNMDQHSVLYDDEQTAFPFYRLITYPDGGLISSVNDLGKYLSELIRGYTGNGTLLSEASYKELFHPQLGDSNFEERDPESEYNDEYNMGIFMGMSAVGNIGHTGGDPGVSTFMFFNEESLTGQIVFLNTSLNEKSFESFVKIWNTLAEYRSEIAVQGK